MTERIDHADAARIQLDFLHEWMAQEGQTDATQISSVLEAQVHATLALVEQQRIANIIAVTDGGATAGPNLIAHVKKSLGLT